MTQRLHRMRLVAHGALLSLSVVGCSAEPTSHNGGLESVKVPKKTESEGTVIAARPLPVKESEVTHPRPGTTFAAIDYAATEGTYHLFGIENGDGQTGRFAIVADARWASRQVHEGDWLGRGLEVLHIGETSITLRGPSGDMVLEAGASAPLRVVQHRLDVVAKPLGRHRYALNKDAARAAPVALPSYGKSSLFGQEVLKLGPVLDGSLLALADLREGDLVAGVDGAPASDGTLPALVEALTSEKATFTLRIVRGGIPLDRVFVSSE